MISKKKKDIKYDTCDRKWSTLKRRISSSELIQGGVSVISKITFRYKYVYVSTKNHTQTQLFSRTKTCLLVLSYLSIGNKYSFLKYAEGGFLIPVARKLLFFKGYIQSNSYWLLKFSKVYSFGEDLICWYCRYLQFYKICRTEVGLK